VYLRTELAISNFIYFTGRLNLGKRDNFRTNETKNAEGAKHVKGLHSVMLPNRTMMIKAKVIMAFRTIAKKGDTISCFFRCLNTANLRV